MGNGGNRFGGISYNRGTDSLMSLYLRNALLSRLRNGRQPQGQQPQAQAQPGMGFTVRPTEFSSGSLPSAAESAAFNERVRDKAVYGSYGQGGIEREKINAQALSDVLKQNMTQRDRADIALKREEHGLRKKGLWNRKSDEWGDGATGTGATPVAGTGQSLGGEKIGGAPAQTSATPAPVAAAQTPSLREVVPSAVPDGPVPANLNMMNMPSGAGMITRRNPDGSMEYLTTGLPGGAPVVEASTLPGKTDEPAGLREVVQSVMAATGQTPPAATKPPAGKKNKIASLKDVSRAKKGKKAVGDTGIGALAEVLKDMFYRAPAQAVGEENIAAAGNTLADMVWRAPMRTAGQGVDWLSEFALGGLR